MESLSLQGLWRQGTETSEALEPHRGRAPKPVPTSVVPSPGMGRRSSALARRTLPRVLQDGGIESVSQHMNIHRHGTGSQVNFSLGLSLLG